ncbi:unnamed protein product [Acanthosepion pharaonis]|uniref:Uncharacterized protein n=1 Tax=Acanthosepion pharaonis TaxID=158019 RepID=A0A812DKA7_ACAPH|nr:unnamed protein product [Sepia pharaonis]
MPLARVFRGRSHVSLYHLSFPFLRPSVFTKDTPFPPFSPTSPEVYPVCFGLFFAPPKNILPSRSIPIFFFINFRFGPPVWGPKTPFPKLCPKPQFFWGVFPGSRGNSITLGPFPFLGPPGFSPYTAHPFLGSIRPVRGYPPFPWGPVCLRVHFGRSVSAVVPPVALLSAFKFAWLFSPSDTFWVSTLFPRVPGPGSFHFSRFPIWPFPRNPRKIFSQKDHPSRPGSFRPAIHLRFGPFLEPPKPNTLFGQKPVFPFPRVNLFPWPCLGPGSPREFWETPFREPRNKFSFPGPFWGPRAAKLKNFGNPTSRQPILHPQIYHFFPRGLWEKFGKTSPNGTFRGPLFWVDPPRENPFCFSPGAFGLNVTLCLTRFASIPPGSEILSPFGGLFRARFSPSVPLPDPVSWPFREAFTFPFLFGAPGLPGYTFLPFFSLVPPCKFSPCFPKRACLRQVIPFGECFAVNPPVPPIIWGKPFFRVDPPRVYPFSLLGPLFGDTPPKMPFWARSCFRGQPPRNDPFPKRKPPLLVNPRRFPFPPLFKPQKCFPFPFFGQSFGNFGRPLSGGQPPGSRITFGFLALFMDRVRQGISAMIPLGSKSFFHGPFLKISLFARPRCDPVPRSILLVVYCSHFPLFGDPFLKGVHFGRSFSHGSIPPKIYPSDLTCYRPPLLSDTLWCDPVSGSIRPELYRLSRKSFIDFPVFHPPVQTAPVSRVPVPLLGPFFGVFLFPPNNIVGFFSAVDPPQFGENVLISPLFGGSGFKPRKGNPVCGRSAQSIFLSFGIPLDPVWVLSAQNSVPFFFGPFGTLLPQRIHLVIPPGAANPSVVVLPFCFGPCLGPPSHQMTPFGKPFPPSTRPVVVPRFTGPFGDPAPPDPASRSIREDKTRPFGPPRQVKHFGSTLFFPRSFPPGSFPRSPGDTVLGGYTFRSLFPGVDPPVKSINSPPGPFRDPPPKDTPFAIPNIRPVSRIPVFPLAPLGDTAAGKLADPAGSIRPRSRITFWALKHFVGHFSRGDPPWVVPVRFRPPGDHSPVNLGDPAAVDPPEIPPFSLLALFRGPKGDIFHPPGVKFPP